MIEITEGGVLISTAAGSDFQPWPEEY